MKTVQRYTVPEKRRKCEPGSKKRVSKSKRKDFRR